MTSPASALLGHWKNTVPGNKTEIYYRPDPIFSRAGIEEVGEGYEVEAAGSEAVDYAGEGGNGLGAVVHQDYRSRVRLAQHVGLYLRNGVVAPVLWIHRPVDRAVAKCVDMRYKTGVPGSIWEAEIGLGRESGHRVDRGFRLPELVVGLGV